MGVGVVRCSGGCWHRAFCLLPSHRVTGRQEEEDRRWWWKSRRRSSWTSRRKSEVVDKHKEEEEEEEEVARMHVDKQRDVTQLCQVVTNVVG